jgi:hypothetical protein
LEVYIHQCFAHIFSGNDTLFLCGEVLVLIGEKVEDLLDFILFLCTDVVLFCEFGGARTLGSCRGGAGSSSTPLGRL